MMTDTQRAQGGRISLNSDILPKNTEGSGESGALVANSQESPLKVPLEERLPVGSRITRVSKSRLTADRDATHMKSLKAVIPPPDYQYDWNVLDINELTPNKIPTDRLLLLLSSVSSEIGKAAFDFQKYCNSNWTWELDSEKEGGNNQLSERSREVIENYIESLESFGTSFDAYLDKLTSGAFVRGAYFFEVVLHRRRPVAFAVADPVLARFRQTDHPILGQAEELGQIINGRFTPLNYPTVFYEPVDSVINSSYGRSLMSPAVFPSLFLLGFLLDLRRVIRQQGYYKVDFSIDLEQLNQRIQQGILTPAEVDAFISQEIEGIRQYYASLGPDDAYVHTSDISVNDVSGSLNTSALTAVESVISLLQNQLTLACKTIPILMGINNSTSETHANRQWEDYMAAIRSCQRSLARALGKAFTLVLQYNGIQDKVIFKFSELSVMTALQFEQMRAVAISNIRNLLGENGGGNPDLSAGEPGQDNPFGAGGGMPNMNNGGGLTPLITEEEAKQEVRRLEELR